MMEKSSNNSKLNPVITKKSGPYETEEGCLSLTGTRKTTRYQRITVKYQDMQMKWHTQDFFDVGRFCILSGDPVER